MHQFIPVSHITPSDSNDQAQIGVLVTARECYTHTITSNPLPFSKPAGFETATMTIKHEIGT